MEFPNLLKFNFGLADEKLDTMKVSDINDSDSGINGHIVTNLVLILAGCLTVAIMKLMLMILEPLNYKLVSIVIKYW